MQPSEHPDDIVHSPSIDLYLPNFHGEVEQSAVYENVHFESVNECDFGIVLTSQCDIKEHGPNNYVLMARIVPVGEILLYWLMEKNKYTEDEAFGKVAVSSERKQRNSLVKAFADSYLKNETFGYYFLPAIDRVMCASLICFEVTKCMNITSLQELRKVAVLQSPFRESVPAHYSAYIGRIGTPALDRDYLREIVSQQCKVLPP